MKQDYNPFSVGLIDLFASSMGMFMILTFISIPSITMTHREAPEETTEVDILAQLESAEDELEMLKAQLESMEGGSDVGDAMAELKSENDKLSKQVSTVKTIYQQDYSMNLPIMFDGNQWYIRPEVKDMVDMVGRELSINEADATIIGHTSGTPDSRRQCLNLDQHGEVNANSRITSIAPIGNSFKQCFQGIEWSLYLSKKRAESIRDYLLANYDINPSRITALGKGAEEHLKDVAADDSRNRRVEINYEVVK